MRIVDQEINAARNLGEALLRFMVAIETTARQRVHSASPPEATPLQTTARKHTSVRMSDGALVTTGVVANMLALSRSKVYGLMETGELPYVKLGKSRRIRLADVQRLIADNLVARRESRDDLATNLERIER